MLSARRAKVRETQERMMEQLCDEDDKFLKRIHAKKVSMRTSMLLHIIPAIWINAFADVSFKDEQAPMCFRIAAKGDLLFSNRYEMVP
ncbi:hypothetical protein G6F38_008741 [Rhizopus arrhizus]|nr:hypothetical protein G6F38_008741 [Rhizopus arrhizus]